VKKVIVVKKKLDSYSKQAHANKFYVGSPKALNNEWGHPTLEGAIAHAEKLVSEDETAHFVVQIVRIVRPRPIETTVEIV
jgi:hypothetical protein